MGLDATTRQEKALNAWAEEAGLVNGGFGSRNIPIVTRSNLNGGNWIDHMLHFSRHQNVECVGGVYGYGYSLDDCIRSSSSVGKICAAICA